VNCDWLIVYSDDFVFPLIYSIVVYYIKEMLTYVLETQVKKLNIKFIFLEIVYSIY